MELVGFKPETAKSTLLPWHDEVILCPIGDVQYGAQGCEVDRFKRHLEWAEGLRARGHVVKYIGMGDYVDVASPSNRKTYRTLGATMYDSFKQWATEKADEHLDKMKELLAPTKGHWLGMLSGHHFWEFDDGTNTDSLLCQYLETPYLGRCALVNLRFESETRKKAAVCKIWAHHGEGSGQAVSAAINKVMQRAVPYYNAHLYLMGHYHSKGTQPLPYLDTYTSKRGDVKLEGMTRYIVSTGGFLAGYFTGGRTRAGLPAPGYIEDAMLAPNTLGAPVIFIRPRARNGRPSIDLNVSV